MLEDRAQEVLKQIVKYLVEGMAVGLAAFIIPSKKLKYTEIIMIAITASACLAILDLLAPTIGNFARHGAGFGLGAGLLGWKGIPGVGVAAPLPL